MAELKGTNIAAGIVPFTDRDKYPTHFSQYGKGGYRTVQTIEERDSIPEERLEQGMLCYVIDDPSGIHTYRLISEGRWQKLALDSTGIPIYDKDELDKLGNEAGKHIFISSENDLNGEITNKTYTTSINGSYLDILFSTIRQLQIEVARIRNSFKYGIYSYTGTETAMSGVIDSISDPEEEPLWAVEPDMLSLIVGADVLISSEVQNLDPINKINPQENKLVLLGKVKWYDKEDLVKSNEDSKIFIYLTVSHLNINLVLESFDKNNTLEIDLSNYSDNIVNLDKYHILVVISRKSEILGGKNYVWLSIGNPKTNVTLHEGYYNKNNKNIDSFITELDNNYTVKYVEMTDLDLFQLDFYSKYQEFTQEVMPSKPNDQDYKYRVAHLTIRSVKNTEELDLIKNQLPNNELIFEEATNRLWIKNNNKLVTISGSGSNGGTDNENTMTDQELIEKLKELGIVYEENTGDSSTLKLSSISDITFIHQATGKNFSFEVNSEGSLVSTEIPNKTLEDRVNALSKTSFAINTSDQIRGFVSKLHCSEDGINPVNTKDVKSNSDRIKIGSMYLPLATDTTFGCSHAYIELENTSDQDFPLDGCYLHFLHPDNNNISVIDHLPLKGILPSGSTFLIRGKQYSDPELNPSTYISVDDYDMEWYINGKLIDLSVKESFPYGFALTYGQENLPVNSILLSENQDSTTKSKAPYIYPYYYIDSIPINVHIDPSNKPWGKNVVTVSSNSIIKNTFELDPAKQAFQSLNTYDSSRHRMANVANDIQVVSLSKETISFPHSEEEYPVKNYSPKSSKQKKNVCSDKTKFDMNKPNAVTCAFGIDIYKTRCFNWVSGGEYDEFVWVKSGETWKKFESYKNTDSVITQQNTYPRRKEFSVDINNIVYARLVGNFPGCNIHYTSHKCIVDVVENSVSSPTKYTYVVGRADKTGNSPDLNHCSSEQNFTLYPETYTPRIYQVTDQQGFHWVEYQVWSASANFLSEKIEKEVKSENIIPVLINTGDMTQNGTRINEWLDYFNGGHPLLNHLEHMAVVGNNDLCGPNPEVLGTGDDSGKSNSYYFHVFFCYEVFSIDRRDTIGKIVEPIVNNKYIPSLYYFDSKDYRFIMANSEVTYASCKTWYGLDQTSGDNDRIYNLYTGHSVVNTGTDTWESYTDSFTSIYTMMWNMLNSKGSKKAIISCHEIPFTVITTECIADSTKGISRSVSGTSLVGCHMNQITPLDNKSLYWFSRLCEFFKVKLVLGGHKHTYTATLPIREYYLYEKSGGTYTKNSKDDGPMSMLETLANDDCSWLVDGKHTSKLPLLYNFNESNSVPSNGYFWPYTNTTNSTYNDSRVVYFMCQATGYKQTSNKELPTNYQSFSKVIPQSIITITDGVVTKSTADNAQKYPMYSKIILGNSSWNILLSRINNIQSSSYKFTQHEFGTGEMIEQFATQDNSNSKYVNWGTEELSLINIDL